MNLIGWLLLGLSSHLASAGAPPKVLIVLNEGYRPEEYFEPRKLFDAAGFSVKVAAHYSGNVLPSRKHITDGRLITGRDPISATLFGQTVVSALKQATP